MGGPGLIFGRPISTLQQGSSSRLVGSTKWTQAAGFAVRNENLRSMTEQWIGLRENVDKENPEL